MKKFAVSLIALALVVGLGGAFATAKKADDRDKDKDSDRTEVRDNDKDKDKDRDRPKLKKVWEARLEPSPGQPGIPSVLFRGVLPTFATFTTERGKRGESKTKAKIETDFNGRGVAKVKAEGLCLAPECGGDFPVGTFSVQVFCGHPDNGGSSMIYEDALQLDEQGNGNATVDISGQLGDEQCTDPAVIIGQPVLPGVLTFGLLLQSFRREGAGEKVS